MNIARLFTNDLGDVPRLSYDDEVRLTDTIRRGEKAAERLQQGASGTALEKAVAEGKAARDTLVLSNMPLVIFFASKYMFCGVPVEDLVQEGAIGLMKAVERYDHTRGIRFSTYAGHWILAAVYVAAASQGRTIRVPVYVHNYIERLVKAQSRLVKRTGREPTTDELADELDLSAEKVDALATIMRERDKLASLEAEIPGLGETALQDTIADDAPALDDLAENALLRDVLERALERIPHNQALVMRLFFYLDGGGRGKQTLSAIGRRLGITKEAVRQRKRRALESLRESPFVAELREFLD